MAILYHVIAQLQKAHYDLKQKILTDIRIISVEEESNYGLSIHILPLMAAFISPFYASYYGVFRKKLISSMISSSVQKVLK